MGDSHILLVQKPSGIPTASYCEWLAHETKEKNFPAHSLDKDISGGLLLSRSAQEAQRLAEQFRTQKIKQTFIFVSDRAPKETAWKDSEALIEFKTLSNSKTFYLIEAQTSSGKTQSLRRAAKEGGVPIVGDAQYGGMGFPFLLLHNSELQITDLDLNFENPWPMIYENLAWLESPQLCRWLHSYERRRNLYPDKISSAESLRLIHKEGTPLRVDKLGDVASLGWWNDFPPTDQDWQDIYKFLEIIKIKEWIFFYHGKNEAASSQKNSSADCPENWQGLENNVNFEFRRNQGVSPGLFLDQRAHRQWLRENSQDQRVLNLFAYTGGFSVYAALGGASKITTIDLSPKYIDWSKKNFTLNKIDPNQEHIKFHCMDSMEYLKYAARKNLVFDKIICDPPSYSRNKGKDFRIDRDFAALIGAISAILAPNGIILFSSNYEHWSREIWQEKLQSFCDKENLKLAVPFHSAWDFEIDPSQTLMKAFHIKKK